MERPGSGGGAIALPGMYHRAHRLPGDPGNRLPHVVDSWRRTRIDDILQPANLPRRNVGRIPPTPAIASTRAPSGARRRPVDACRGGRRHGNAGGGALQRARSIQHRRPFGRARGAWPRHRALPPLSRGAAHQRIPARNPEPASCPDRPHATPDAEPAGGPDGRGARTALVLVRAPAARPPARGPDRRRAGPHEGPGRGRRPLAPLPLRLVRRWLDVAGRLVRLRRARRGGEAPRG